MKIAVTGAGGLLGRSLIHRLSGEGHEVIAMSSSLAASEQAKVVRWSTTRDRQFTTEVLRGVEVVIHTAAHIPCDHGDASQAERCLAVNALGTLELLQASELAGIRRFVYVSGANVLRPREGLVREDDPVGCEQAPFYLGSKLLGEIYVRAAMARGLDGLIVRPSSIYGPGMKTGVLWTFAERLRTGSPISLKDGGRFQADYVWRDDVAQVLCEAASSPHRGVVNLGSGHATPLTEVAELLCELLDADRRLIEVEPTDSRPVPSAFAAVDISRARQWFRFRPTALRDGLTCWFGAGVR